MKETVKIQLGLLVSIVIIAFLTLIAWYTNNIGLARLHSGFIPMPPLTACILLILSSVNGIWLLKGDNKTWSAVLQLLIYALLIVLLLILLDNFYFERTLDLESIFGTYQETFKGYPVGRITEGALILSTLAAISFVRIKSTHKVHFQKPYALFTLIIFVACAAILLAYIQRFPILFDKRVVPVALWAALGFWLLSIVQLIHIDFKIWPFSIFRKKTTAHILVKILIPIVIGLLLLQEIIENYLIQDKKDPLISTLFIIITLLTMIFLTNYLVNKIGKKLDETVKKLIESKSQFHSLSNNATVGLYQSTPNGKVLSANKTLLTMLQYDSFEELAKVDISKGSYLYPEKRNEFKDKLAQYGEITNFESEWVTKYGKVLYVKEGARVVKDENGIIIRYEGVVEDITEQKLNQQKLEEKDVKIKNFFENSKVIYYSHNVDFELSYVSPQITEILGYKPADVKNNRTRFYTDNPINILGLNKTKETLKTGIKHPPFELEVYHKNGSKIWFEVNESPVLREGKVIGIDGSLTDITDRKRNEQTQQILLNIANESQFNNNPLDFYRFIHQQLNKIINAENFYIALYIEENDAIHIPYFQDEFDDETDFPAEGTLTGLLIKEEKSLLLKEQEINQLIEAKKLNIIGNDCKIWLGAPLKSNNKVLGAIVVQSYNDENAYTKKDVELIELIANQIAVSIERKRFKDELIVSKELAEQKTLDYLYLTKNIQGMVYKALPDWSVSFITNSELLTGYPDSLLLDGTINWNSIIIKEDLDQVISQSKVLIEKPSSLIQEYRIRTSNNTIKHVIDYKTSIFDKDNNFKGVDGIVFDSTEQKLLQQELIHAKEKAEESDRLKSAFLANMSHEIRTPMNAIIGFSELLSNNNLSVEKRDKFLEIIQKSGKRLMNIVTNIVEISKLDSKQFHVNLEEFDLNKLIESLHQQFELTAKQKNIHFTVHKGLDNGKAVISSDETRLAQVISNLLENAFKFTQTGEIAWGYRVKENELEFVVKDSGVGIKKEHHQIIFDRFSQSDNEIQKVKEGTGLGLSIAKGILELLGGTIWVESETNKGASFYFTIPFKQSKMYIDEVTELTIPQVVTAINQQNILIAEDEISNYYVIEAFLEELPFNLIHVMNGKEAVAMVNSNTPIDLVLMDINMPIMNGLDATTAIRLNHPKLPVIAVTAYALESDREKALSYGCTDYLTKPLSKKLLIETLLKYSYKTT